VEVRSEAKRLPGLSFSRKLVVTALGRKTARFCTHSLRGRRRAAFIHTDSTLAKERGCRFTSPGSAPPAPERRPVPCVGDRVVGGSDSTPRRCAFTRRDVHSDDGAHHLGDRHDPPGSWCLEGPWLGRILRQAQVRATPMIIVCESSQVARQASFTAYDYVIQALLPNGADHTLQIGSLPGGEQGAASTCLMPIAFTCFTKSAPKIRSRSRSRSRSAVSQGKASRSC
jgi:hypothetical protein